MQNGRAIGFRCGFVPISRINRVDGAVLMLVDIDTLKRSEQAQPPTATMRGILSPPDTRWWFLTRHDDSHRKCRFLSESEASTR